MRNIRYHQQRLIEEAVALTCQLLTIETGSRSLHRNLPDDYVHRRLSTHYIPMYIRPANSPGTLPG